jgi:sporulation protein YlmC with PRC-barrel domain
MLSWPYYVGMGGMGMGASSQAPMDAGPLTTSRDRVPVGEVEVRRGEHVHATDGAIGRVQGLVVDPGDHHVTHVLLDQGHLWGQKRVAIPILAVTSVEDGVRLNLTKAAVRDLPTVDLDQPA